MAYNRINYLKRVGVIQEKARKYYEPGRQDRNWRWVWRNHINPRYHICYNTFLKYMNISTDLDQDERCLEGRTLFDDLDF